MTIEERLINLFKRHKYFFKGTISHSYALTNQQLEKYQKNLLWKECEIGFFMYGLSNNPQLNWTEELLLKYKDKWHWGGISCYIIGKYLWDDEILDRLEKHIEWSNISWNQGIPWNEELLDKYKDKIDWGTFSSNTVINWTGNLLEKYSSLIDFQRISNNHTMPWSNSKTHLHVETPSSMKIQQSIDLIEKYENQLDWNNLFFDWENGLNRSSSDYIINELF